MVRLTGRLLAAVLLVLAGLAVAMPQPAAAQPLRKSVTALTPAELMSLRTGVATMMARNSAPRGSADFRRSWVYWANMHAHFGSSCRGAIKGTNMTGVQLWAASNPTETATWCKCAHSVDQFLTWHRMYIWYFERVLQQAANDPTLRLPYWDYTTDPILPAAFRDATYVNQAGQTVPNPLRVEARSPTLNSGAAGLAAGTVSTSNAMAATGYTTFRTRLESTPHGAVHCAIAVGGCPNGLMGAQASAALDPIFYLHHSNIDRLYECWLQVNEAARLPTSTTLLNTNFSFIDGDGSLKTRRVRDMLRTSQLGYGYSAGGGCPAAPVAPAVGVAVAQATGRMAMGGRAMASTELQRGVTELSIDVEGAGGAAPALAPEAPAAARPATVIIEGFTAAKVPGVLYNVYLADDQGRREQIGVIDFFGFDDNGAMPGHGTHAGGRRFEFDATAAAATLGLGPSRHPKLIFEPTTGLTDSTVAAAVKAIPPDAKVSFKRAWLRVGN